MQWNANKLWQTAAASLVAMTSYLNADYDNAQVRNLENRVSALEQKKGANGMINPNGRPEVRDGADLFLTADVLLWQAHEGGLGYVVESHQGNLTTPLNHSNIENPHFDYDWGFRIGAGYNLPHDGWDLYATWTRMHMHSHHHEHHVADGDHFLWPVWMHPNSSFSTNSTFVEEAHAHWRLRLNVIDLEMGRELFTSKWLTLRPHIGLRTSWIDQYYDVDYENIRSQQSPGGTIITQGHKVDIDMKNKFWGLGPRFGLDTQWGLGSGFSIFGNAAFSLLYGFFETAFHELDRQTNNIGVPYGATHNSFRQTVAITDLQLGLRWDHMFDKDRFHFGLQAGWEHHMFFSQNQFSRFVDNYEKGNFIINQGDLTTQGWTLSARFDF